MSQVDGDVDRRGHRVRVIVAVAYPEPAESLLGELVCAVVVTGLAPGHREVARRPGHRGVFRPVHLDELLVHLLLPVPRADVVAQLTLVDGEVVEGTHGLVVGRAENLRLPAVGVLIQLPRLRERTGLPETDAEMEGRPQGRRIV